MSRRLKITILLIVLIIILGFLAYLIYRLTSAPEVIITNSNISTVSGIKGLEDEEIPEVVDLAELSLAKREELLTRTDLERFSSMFAERYTSYSNQSGYVNWEDLKIFMSAKMKQEIDQQKAEALAGDDLEVYHGFTSKAVSTNIDSYDSLKKEAVVEVTLQQKEAEGHSDNFRLTYKKLILDFIKEESQGWKVDSAKWE